MAVESESKSKSFGDRVKEVIKYVGKVALGIFAVGFVAGALIF